MKAEDIFKVIDSELAPLMSKNGFMKYKGKSYLRITDGVIQIIQVFCLKSDLHFWYACYPITEKDVWFGAATEATSGRYPEAEKEISVNNLKSLQSSLSSLNAYISKALGYLNQRKSLRLLSDSISKDNSLFPGLVKGYCLVSLGLKTEAVQYFESIIKSELGDTWKNNATEMLESIRSNNTQELLESYKNQNMKN